MMIGIKDMKMPKNCDRCPLYTYWSDGEDYCGITKEGVMDFLNGPNPDCPLVEIEKPKTGHWIALGNYDDYGEECSYKCSECGDIDTYHDNFCPECGTEMIGIWKKMRNKK